MLLLLLLKLSNGQLMVNVNGVAVMAVMAVMAAAAAATVETVVTAIIGKGAI